MPSDVIGAAPKHAVVSDAAAVDKDAAASKDAVSGKGTDSAATKACLPIGLFDSGVGGLTVFSALRDRLPQERLIYLGDTARLPYGTKGPDTIVRYALQATEKLVEQDIKLLVVACNTATAVALPALQMAYSHLPVIGVVEPGSRAACAASKSGRILVLGTESTIRGEAYTRAIHALQPEAKVMGIPCSLFVAMAEEGWMHGPIIESVAARYLAPVLQMPPEQRPDCVVLGCTHFPPLAPAIRAVLGDGPVLVDSAATTAEAVEQELTRLHLLRPPVTAEAQPGADTAGAGSTACASATCAYSGPQHYFLTTDAPERFARVGEFFIGQPIPREHLELVVL